MKKKIKTFVFPVIFALAAGILLGYLFFKNGGHEDHLQTDASEEVIYTCSMHPQIRQNEPGKCPICGMDLIPLSSGKKSGDKSSPFIYSMTKEAVALANIQTSKAGRKPTDHEIFFSGRIGVNEKNLKVVTADFSGRIEKLFVNYTGQNINKGDKLITIYSPDLVMAQKELLEAGKNREHLPALYEAAKEKLKLWKLSDFQIDNIESTGEVVTEFDIESDVSGIVMDRKVSHGNYVNKGGILFEIADLSSLWLIMDVYENDLRWIRKGDKIVFTVPAFPEKEFASNIEFVDPVIDSGTRTLKVRAEISNRSGLLKPEMFANVKVISKRKPAKDTIMVPKSSVLWTGKRSVVYVKVSDDDTLSFEMREVKLGNRIGNYFVVNEGLYEDEEIVTNGVFAVDSAAQLSGNYSMMNRPSVNNVSTEFKTQLTKLVENYFILKDSFVESDSKKAGNAAKKMIPLLKSVDMKLLEEDDHTKWMEILDVLSEELNMIAKSGDIKSQRIYFEHVSDGIIEASKFFGLTKREVFVQFCPMAFDNTGAFWLSEEKEIMNPYFGDVMLHCGDVTKTIRSTDIRESKPVIKRKEETHRH